MPKPNRWLLGLMMLGVSLRLILFVIAQPWTEQGESRLLSGSADIRSYHYLAHDLVLYGRYGGHPEADPRNLDPAIRPLGYALFIAFWYQLFEPRIWYVLLIQIVLSALSIALIYSIARREFGERAARVASLMFTIYPNGILFACSLMTETLYIFTTLLFLEAWSRFKQNLTPTARAVIAYGLLLGFLFGLSVYVRVATIYLALLVPFALWFFHNAFPSVQRLWLIGSFFSALLLTVMPYSLYMYQRYSTFRMTIVDDYNLLVNTVGHALGGRRGRIDPEAVAFKTQIRTEAEERMRSDGVDPVESNPFLRGPYYRQLALEYIRRYPSEMTWGILRGIARFWFWPDRIWEVAHEVLPERIPARRVIVGIAFVGALSYHLTWLGLLIAGMFFAWRFHREWFWMVLIVSLYLTLTTNASGNDRFRMQSAAFTFPLVGLGYLGLAARKKQKTLSEVQYP